MPDRLRPKRVVFFREEDGTYEEFIYGLRTGDMRKTVTYEGVVGAPPIIWKIQ